MLRTQKTLSFTIVRKVNLPIHFLPRVHFTFLMSSTKKSFSFITLPFINLVISTLFDIAMSKAYQNFLFIELTKNSFQTNIKLRFLNSICSFFSQRLY